MFDDFFAGTRGSVSGEVDGVKYSLSFGEVATKWWLAVIVALVLGVWLGSRVTVVR